MLTRLTLAAVAVIAADPAFAQTAATTVGVGGVYHTVVEPMVLTTVSVVLTAILGWGAALFQKATHIKVEDAWRESIHSAAMTGVTAALHRLGVKADGMTFDVKNKVVADALTWVLSSVPDAVKGLGLDKAPDKLAELVQSKLGLLAQTPGTVEAAKAVPNA